ncbi:MAG: DUF3426 domain-containing protein [Alphaproteobacteria bacterium]|nr:DUF3426 domain-containing protein [Alphaproteobacteria bacterium]
MILTCPACDTRYSVDPNSLLPSGRTVRCAKCGNTWTEMPPGDMPRSVEPPMVMPRMSAPDPDPDDDVEVPSIEEMTVEAERPLFRPRAGGARAPKKPVKAERNWSPMIAWGSFVVVVGGLVAGIVLARGMIMDLWPPATQLYQLVGLGAEKAPALTIANIAPAWETDGVNPVIVITGVITNETDEAQRVPKLRGALLDARQPPREVFAWTFDPPVETIEARAKKEFSTRVPNPPAVTRGVGVTLLTMDAAAAAAH